MFGVDAIFPPGIVFMVDVSSFVKSISINSFSKWIPLWLITEIKTSSLLSRFESNAIGEQKLIIPKLSLHNDCPLSPSIKT